MWKIEPQPGDLERKAWLGLQQDAVHQMLQIAAPHCKMVKDDKGKPHLSPARADISVSHSGQLAALYVSETGPCGIDLELVADKVLRIERKFCSEDESGSLDRVSHREALHLIWGAKEALYKLYGRKEVDFRTQLFIEPFEPSDSGHLFGHTRLPGLRQRFRLGYRFMDGYCLVWTEA
jgi:4'-phosphopantetheinyl transferase EntD